METTAADKYFQNPLQTVPDLHRIDQRKEETIHKRPQQNILANIKLWKTQEREKNPTDKTD